MKNKSKFNYISVFKYLVFIPIIFLFNNIIFDSNPIEISIPVNIIMIISFSLMFFNSFKESKKFYMIINFLGIIILSINLAKLL